MVTPIDNSFWSITREAQIPAPAERVWEAIAAPEGLEKCYPFVEVNPVEKWPGVGSKDMLRYYNGLTFYREFYAWEEGLGFDLMIGQQGRLDSKVSWRVQSTGVEESILTITVWPLGITGWKKLFYWAPMLVYLRPLMNKYLYAVVGGYRFFITTGNPVPRNHFGPLRVFSPSVE